MVTQHEKVDELAGSVERALAAGHRDDLVACLSGLRDALDEHLDLEETAVLPLVHRYLTVPEWLVPQKAAEAALPKSFRARMLLAGAVLEDATPPRAGLVPGSVAGPGASPVAAARSPHVRAAHTRAIRRDLADARR